jgi:glycosyltransferase involved in cell wall biosynthesis
MSVAFVVPSYRVDSYMAGIGVRAWELAQTLAPHMPVTIVAKGESDLRADGVRLVPASESSWPDAVRECDAAVFFDMPDTRVMLAMHRAGKLVISDNFVPIEHLEYHNVRRADAPDAAYNDLVARFKLQLLLSDHFIARSRVARATLVAGLSLVGRLNYLHYDQSARLDHLLSLIPIGFNRESLRHAEAAPASLPAVDFVWSGGLWDFYDPVSVIEAIGLLNRDGVPVTIRFMYMPPPDQVLEEAKRLTSAARECGVEHLVEFYSDALPHNERDGVVKSARAGICIGKDGIENYTSIRLRLRDTFLYGLPLVVDSHGATGDLVRALDVGLAVNSEDVDSIASALARMKSDTETYQRFTRNIELVRRDYQLDLHARKLIEVVKRGRQAPDVGTPRHRQLVGDLLWACPALEESPSYPI